MGKGRVVWRAVLFQTDCLVDIHLGGGITGCYGELLFSSFLHVYHRTPTTVHDCSHNFRAGIPSAAAVVTKSGCVQAADFLDDQETFRHLCKQAGHLLFELAAIVMPRKRLRSEEASAPSSLALCQARVQVCALYGYTFPCFRDSRQFSKSVCALHAGPEKPTQQPA